MEQLDRSGVTLCYEDVGKGFPSILLVHDLAYDHRSFAPQIEYFRQMHRVVAVDLRGHGQSDKPMHDYTVRSFAEDLAWLCLELGIHKPVVVGHGLGGMIGIELAIRYPDLLSGIVALDPIVLPTSAGKVLREGFLNALCSSNDRIAGNRSLEPLPLLREDCMYLKEVMEATSRLPHHVAVSVWKNTLSWELMDALKSCSVPLFYLSARVSSINLVHLFELRKHIIIGQTSGKGHFHQLEAPEQVNAAIEHFVEVIAPDSRTKIAARHTWHLTGL